MSELKLYGMLTLRNDRSGITIEFEPTGGGKLVGTFVDRNSPAFGVLENFKRRLEPRLVSEAEPELPVISPEEPKQSEESKSFVRRCYDLTTRFHIATGKKVVIHDLLEAFFASTIKDIDEEDQALFEARLVERLESLSPGWDK